MENDNVQLIRSLSEAYTAAWCSQDPDRVAALYEEDGSLTVNDEAPAIGRVAIADVARGFMTGFPDMQVRLDRLVFQDDGVFYHWTLTGTNNGPGGTGRNLAISGYEVWQIGANGLIASSQGHFETAEYYRQLGITV